MDWQKGEYQTFQIMWSTKPHNNCLPPLQLRSFTSDSYRAIKERERKRCQQKKAASKQWRTVPHSEARRESASLDAVVDVLWKGAELDDDIYMSDSRRSQPVAQEDCRVRSDGGTQQNLHQPSAQPIGTVEVDYEGMILCLDASTSSASSSIAPGSTFLELITDTELGSDSSQAVDPQLSSASAHEVDMIVPVDVNMPVEEPGSAILHKTALAFPTPSHSTPIHSCVSGCNPEPCERPMQDDDGDSASPPLVSPRLVSSQPNTVHVLAAAMGPSRDEFALAMGLLNAEGHTCRNGHQGACNCQAGLDQAGRSSKKRGSVPQALWTKDLDEYLLHLRNVAQLKWGDLVDYFPTRTLSAIKRRHKQLSEAKDTTQDMGDQDSARFKERSTAASPPASTSGKRAPKIAKHHHATSGLLATSKLAKPGSSLRRRRETRQTNNAKVATSPALPICDGTSQRSSRCGRPIRHPFRHRPKEGYL